MKDFQFCFDLIADCEGANGLPLFSCYLIRGKESGHVYFYVLCFRTWKCVIILNPCFIWNYWRCNADCLLLKDLPVSVCLPTGVAQKILLLLSSKSWPQRCTMVG